MGVSKLQHKFVDSFPDELESGVLYIALDFATMSHLCCCGCGQEVVTQLSPKDWRMTFDGETISIHPSIGSWSLPCRSHYIIRNGQVQWAENWTKEQIRLGRERDLILKRGNLNAAPLKKINDKNLTRERISLWKRVLHLFQFK